MLIEDFLSMHTVTVAYRWVRQGRKLVLIHVMRDKFLSSDSAQSFLHFTVILFLAGSWYQCLEAGGCC